METATALTAVETTTADNTEKEQTAEVTETTINTADYSYYDPDKLQYINPEELNAQLGFLGYDKAVANIHNNQLVMIQEQRVISEQLTDTYKKLDEIYTVGVYILVILIIGAVYKLFNGLFQI